MILYYFPYCACTSLASYLVVRLHMFVRDFFFPLMQLTPDEEQRRKLRRERNKVAASKCRMKRKEHVNTLRKVGVHFCSFNLV